MPYDMTYKSAGDEISSTYEGRHIEMTEALITHPDHTVDGVNLVQKGDPIVIGAETGVGLVGVAFKSAQADSDLIAIDTEGIWALNVTAKKEAGANSAIARGDRLYIKADTCAISKNSGYRQFGYALSTLASGDTGIVAVKVHAN